MSGIFVQVRNVSRTVPTKTILDHLTVDFRKGEVTALIGPSGCGKSTLLKAICGIERADAPRHSTDGIFYNGKRYYDNIEKLSSKIAYLPQFDSEWLHEELTVKNELSYIWRLRETGATGLWKQGKAYLEGGIEAQTNHFGLAGNDNTQISTLSGGEKKRAAIIGVTLSKPELLLLDEPTAPLDPGASAKLVETLVQDAKANHVTTIMVTHDPIALQGLGDDCHVVLLKRKGKGIGFDGTYRQLGQILKNHYQVNSVEIGIQKLFVDFNENVNLDFLETCAQEGLTPIRKEANSVGKPIGCLRQYALLLKREFSILRSKSSSLLTMLAIPIVLGMILGLVVDKNEIYTSYNMTKAMMFSLSACAFFAGVFDSIGVFSNKARIKVEELHGLKIGSYVIAVATTMTALCFVQSLILFTIFSSMAGLPKTVLYNSGFDMFITSFLCALSASMLGMMCSSLFSKTTYIAPVLVVLQIVFSGMIFTLDGVTKWISYFVSCHWAMNALAAICDLNSLPVEVEVPNVGLTSIYYTNSDFSPETITLFTSWLMLLFLCIAALLCCYSTMKSSRNSLFRPHKTLSYAARMGARAKAMIQERSLLVSTFAIIVALALFMFGGTRVDLAGLLSDIQSYIQLIINDIPAFFESLLS